MTHIPDEAVRAALNEWYSIGTNADRSNERKDMRRALTAAIPHLQLGFEVKQLEWVSETPYHVARTRIGFYCIEAVWEDGKLEYVSLSGSLHAIKKFKSIEEAKDAAQDDFERHISSCVVTKPVDVAAVCREALERISRFDRSHGSWETIAYDAINIAGRALSAEPAQGGYSVADELRDLHQSILQSETLADFNAIKNTVNFIYNAPTSEAGA